MRIKTLQITGFKSFVDKTVFRFQPGITGIVGPNGCGKSNVVDAMRWCMGEQSPRRLRGKGMDDVIFAGAEGRPPVSMAEVVLTFDNSSGVAPPAFASFTEIQVARRLYRSGESEYLLNKTPCRMRDIVDFFRDTGIGTKGYTIVEQGQIASIVSAKPDDRRALIEEAAGISKYKARRREAERKLEATGQNLVRVNDVLSEIRRQLNTIERQARKAARYKRLRESQRVLELCLARDDRARLLEEVERLRRQRLSEQDRATAFETELAEREAALEEHRLGLAERERLLHQGDEALFALRGEIKELESRIAYENREREALAESVAAKAEERARLGERLRSDEGQASALETELDALERRLADGARAIAEAEAEAGRAGESLRGLEAERDGAQTHLVALLTAIARAEDRLAALDDRRAEIDQRLRAADERIEVGQTEAANAAGEQEHLEQGLRNLLAERDRLMNELRLALQRQERASSVAREAGVSLREAREAREVCRARLASLAELIERREDLSAATRHLLERDELAEAHGIRSLVRDVLEVDRVLERAVGAALSERAGAMVVRGPEGALGAIRALRDAQAGRGVFVPESAEVELPAGIVPLGEPLLARVRARPGFEAVARTLLAGVQLVDDLHEVVSRYGSHPPATFVTPDGDAMTPDGVVRGGSATSGADLFARVNEVRDLEAELARHEAAVERCESTAYELETAAATVSDEVENLRSRHHTAALAVANHEKDLERTRERVKALGEAREGRVAERSALLAESDQSGAERERLEQSLATSRRERGERQTALDALLLRIGAAARELARLESGVTEYRVAHAGRTEKRDRLAEVRDRARAAAAEATAWIARREEEIRAAEARRGELAESVAEAERLLARRLEDEEAARASTAEKRQAFERQAEAVRGVEEEARRLRGEASAAREALGQAELRVREDELRLGHLDESIRERWGVDLATWEPPAADAAPAPAPAASEGEEGEAAAEEALAAAAARDALSLTAEERRERLSQVRQKLEALGEVNLGAIEEHEELNERYRFLSEQKADLEATVASLREAIARINRTSRKRFRETFDAVDERFRANFPRLFRGGKANLVLGESDDVLEAGVDIVAQPPGKRLQNVNLLSGGEKTLTAIALLVALFQVRPSPFFLLDEVDAALDDANVGRFNEIVRDMAKDSQFLVITHNKRTIEIADMLYGVTMEDRGVSKLVGVELH